MDTDFPTFNNEDIFDCDEMRDFWVSWSHGQFRHGKGLSVGSNLLIAVDKDMIIDSIDAHSMEPAKWIIRTCSEYTCFSLPLHFICHKLR